MLEPTFPNPITNQIQPTPLPLIVEDQPKFEISTLLTPRLTTDVTTNFNTLSDGWAMKALTKNLLDQCTELGNATKLVVDFSLGLSFQARPLSNL